MENANAPRRRRARRDRLGAFEHRREERKTTRARGEEVVRWALFMGGERRWRRSGRGRVRAPAGEESVADTAPLWRPAALACAGDVGLDRPAEQGQSCGGRVVLTPHERADGGKEG